MRTVTGLVAIVCLAAGAAAQGQQPPAPKPAPKKPSTGQTVEIRGQAPTPQVVTVRPREVPEYKPSSLPQAVMTSGNWPAISSAYSVAPVALLTGRLPIDTSQAGLARGGAAPGMIIAGSAALAAGGGPAGAAGGAGAPGASAEEIEAMRREMAMRKARLDSLERAMRDNAARQNAAASAAAGAAGPPRMTAADSAARVAEIAAIRKELNYRKARLDSLQKEVNSLGGTKSKKSSTKSDTTKSGKPPRGAR